MQDVRYSPSGDHFASVGSDSKVFLYDGNTGDTIAEFTDDSHTGTIVSLVLVEVLLLTDIVQYGVSWGPDSKSFVTSAADRTVKLCSLFLHGLSVDGPNYFLHSLGDVEVQKVTTTWTLGTGLDHQQVGNTWTGGDNIVSLSICGDLNVFDKRIGDKPARVLQVPSHSDSSDSTKFTESRLVKAPSKAVTTAISSSTQTFVAGTADGRILAHSGEDYKSVEGTGHSSFVVGLASSSSGAVYSTGYDDQVREIDVSSQGFV